MNRTNKSEIKKVLVRNTTKPVSKTTLLSKESSKETPHNKEELKTQPVIKQIQFNTNRQSKFNEPELNFSSRIADKVNLIEKTQPKRTKSTSDIAAIEKMTRRMNFPQDQKLYKDLIPLCVPTKSQPILSSREPAPQKDKEPVLSDFAEATCGKEYMYRPTVKLDKKKWEEVSPLNSLRLYKILQMNS